MSEAARLQLGMLEDEAQSGLRDSYQPVAIAPRVPSHVTSKATGDGGGSEPEEGWADVAYEGDIGSGEWKSIDVDGVVVAVFNLEGRFYAIEDVCTHDGGTLTGGTVQGDQVICPRHGARFSIKTGAVLSPPAYEPIATFPLRVRDGVIQVRDNRWDK
jgi:3-phenylpropionate/trans-cinnamate dioxygenase ferredoxin subunit